MNQYQEADSVLQRYLRLMTFPIGLSMVETEEHLPPAYRPLVAKSPQVPACQVISYARRYGWKALIRAQDNTCPLGALALGFAAPKPELMDGSAEVPSWVRTREARAKVAQQIPKLPFGAYRYMIAAPLESVDFEPQMVIIYGNPAQMMRLVQASICMTGDPVVSSSVGAVGCGGYISRTLLSGECQMVVSGAGDRIFALTQDHEMCFSIPGARLQDVLFGLKETYQYGMRYPTPSYLFYEPKLPKSYSRMMNDLAGDVALPGA